MSCFFVTAVVAHIANTPYGKYFKGLFKLKTTIADKIKCHFNIRKVIGHINTGELIYIDDYAHHPEEIRATVKSVRAMFPNHRITGVFQPHLFSRTKDFAKEFAVALELLDELFLLDIYPARELPVAGVDSALIGRDVRRIPVNLCSKELLPEMLSLQLPQVFLSMGAGDIDREVAAIKNRLMSLINKM